MFKKIWAFIQDLEVLLCKAEAKVQYQPAADKIKQLYIAINSKFQRAL